MLLHVWWQSPLMMMICCWGQNLTIDCCSCHTREKKVNRILLDGGSGVHIFPSHMLKELGISIEELSQSHLIIQGFNQGGQRALGTI